MKVTETGNYLLINCPDWYRRADFCAMLQQYAQFVPGQQRLATWYSGQGDPE
jgi:hypothetical protein